MRKLDTSSASTTNGFPPKQGTWDFLQLAYRECIEAVCASLLGGSYLNNTLYRIYGCEASYDNSIGPPGLTAYSITAGALFYNGEIYFVDAAGFVTNGNSIDVSIVKTQYTTNADPVQFSGGGAPVNVHNIFKIKFSTQTVAQPNNIFFGTGNPVIKDTKIIDSGWLPITTYVNNYINHGTVPLRFRKIGSLVRIDGITNNSVPGTVSTNQDMFIIGFPPTRTKRFTVADSVTPANAQVQISTSGLVTIMGASIATKNNGVYLDSISYFID